MSNRPETQWAPDQAVMPSAEVKEGVATIHNIRHFDAYYDRSIPIGDVVSADFIVVPLTRHVGTAHTFVSFGLADETHLAVSVEARRRKGEQYSAVRGLFNHYPLMYVIGDENDLIGRRLEQSDVYVYPVNATPERAQKMFLSMLERANTLKERPEPYNTITNSCTANVVRHVNSVVPQRVPWVWQIALSTFTDRLAYKLKLVDASKPFPAVRAAHRVFARSVPSSAEDFSTRIRVPRT